MTAESALSLFSADQRELVDTLNDTDAPMPEHALSVLIETADVPGDAAAVVTPDRVLCRARLLAGAAEVATRLTAAGVGAGDRVVCCFEPGWEYFVAVAAVLRMGGVVIGVAPETDRIARWQQAGRSGATVVLTQWWLADRLDWPAGLTAVPITETSGGATPAPQAPRTPEQACLIIDDGGRPVVLSHREVVAMVTGVADRVGAGAGDRVLALAPPGTGMGLFEVFATLLLGATAVVCADIDLADPAAWTALVRDHEITLWHSSPTLLGMFTDHLAEADAAVPESLRVFLLGGERLAPELVRRLRDRATVEPEVWHLGAARVPGLWVSAGPVGDEAAEQWRSVPIGRPLPNQRVHILSDTMAPCPIWVTGRIYFSGLCALPAVGAGMEYRPTISHPETERTLVATGAFGRLLPNGAVEVVGYESAQVTVFGRPLYMQDAEVALSGLDDVLAAVVVPVDDAAASVGFARLAPESDTDGDRLLDRLRRRLSPYLLPRRIEVVTRFPLLPDGRVDRAALARRVPPRPEEAPAAVDATGSATTGQADDTATLTREVTTIVCRVLGVGDIEPNMDLRDLGATSVELVRLATILEEERGIVVDVEQLLRFPSIAVIVSGELVNGTRPGTPPAVAASAPAATDSTLTGVVERQQFKDAAHGVRHEFDTAAAIDLRAERADRPVTRRTHRRFDRRPVEFAALAGLLGLLRRIEHESRRAYPSAGSAYPVTAYLVVEPGRVRELPGGAYYYHPERNCLVPLESGACSAMAHAHAEINRRSHAESAFTLYLIARMPAITPLYGPLSEGFAMFEAGAMTQLLMTAAAGLGLGLCPVGTMDTQPLTEVLRLGPDDRFLHAIFGGCPAEDV
ncbi:AMP-binding protein [Nocardia sp. NPDC047038]|uniref:AMP-binding protein n=1 Tax=Nocardia sp. NPDC047038 TaxID=3154338 RepID=UPI0033DEA5FC